MQPRSHENTKKNKLSFSCLRVFVVAFALTPQVRSTWDGVYTEAQAKRGETIYAERCASCHAPDLSGKDQAPALADADFRTEWDGLSINDLFERTRISMPADKPGSLDRTQVADVLALVLQKNDFPAGATELPAEPDQLKALTFAAKRR
jgi:mono/diheme cytochrome c family protein